MALGGSTVALGREDLGVLYDIDRGRLLLNGIELFIRPNFVLSTNNSTLLSGNGTSNCAVGLNVGVDMHTRDARGRHETVRTRVRACP